jgi:hypothetical protein
MKEPTLSRAAALQLCICAALKVVKCACALYLLFLSKHMSAEAAGSLPNITQQPLVSADHPGRLHGPACPSGQQTQYTLPRLHIAWALLYCLPSPCSLRNHCCSNTAVPTDAQPGTRRLHGTRRHSSAWPPAGTSAQIKRQQQLRRCSSSSSAAAIRRGARCSLPAADGAVVGVWCSATTAVSPCACCQGLCYGTAVLSESLFGSHGV